MNASRTLLTALLAAGVAGFALAPAPEAEAQRSNQRAKNSAKAQQDLPPLRDPESEKPGLQVGETVPDVTVYDDKGNEVNLNDQFTGGLTLVMFYRGGWCPYCQKSLKEWGPQIGRFKEQDIRVIAISPETPEHTVETKEKTNANFTVYSDMTTEAMRAFGVAFKVDPKTKKQYQGYGIDLDSHNASGEWILPAPAFFLVSDQGKVKWQWATWDYTKRRASPDDVLIAAREQR